MGDPFCRGLARAAGVGGGVLNLENKLIAGDRTTAISAIGCMSRAMTELSISSNKMGAKDAAALVEGLKGNETLTSLRLPAPPKRLHSVSAPCHLARPGPTRPLLMNVAFESDEC